MYFSFSKRMDNPMIDNKKLDQEKAYQLKDRIKERVMDLWIKNQNQKGDKNSIIDN